MNKILTELGHEVEAIESDFDCHVCSLCEHLFLKYETPEGDYLISKEEYDGNVSHLKVSYNIFNKDSIPTCSTLCIRDIIE